MGNRVIKSERFNKVILIPTDFSAVAENAMVHGLEIAQLLNYKVCLLHVYSNRSDTILNKDDVLFQSTWQDLTRCKEWGEQKYSVHIDPLIREGNLFKVLNSTVAEIKPRLMLMGTHGKQGLQHLFGSHALRVVLDSPCPVMVVQGRAFSTGYKRILLPVNSEIDPQHLIEWVLLLYKLFNSEIYLFEAIEPNSERSSITKGITTQIAGVLKENGISFNVNTANSANNFSNQVIAHSDECQSDLVITMTRPAADDSGYSFLDWNERLMFNTEQIPVMFIDRTDMAG